MLNLQAIFTRKADDYPVWNCVIEKIVELPENEYKYLKTAPLRDMPFIAENTDIMYRTKMENITACWYWAKVLLMAS